VFRVIGCRHSGNRGLCHAAVTGGLACKGRATRRRKENSIRGSGNADIHSVCNGEADSRGGDDNDDAMTSRSQKAPATPRPPPGRRPDMFSGACSGASSRSQQPLRTPDPSQPSTVCSMAIRMSATGRSHVNSRSPVTFHGPAGGHASCAPSGGGTPPLNGRFRNIRP
jgi:hypothetical protein